MAVGISDGIGATPAASCRPADETPVSSQLLRAVRRLCNITGPGFSRTTGTARTDFALRQPLDDKQHAARDRDQ